MRKFDSLISLLILFLLIVTGVVLIKMSAFAAITVENFSVDDATINPNSRIIFRGIVKEDGIPKEATVKIHDRGDAVKGDGTANASGEFVISLNSPDMCGTYNYHPHVTITDSGGFSDLTSTEVRFYVNRVKIINITISDHTYHNAGSEIYWDPAGSAMTVTIGAEWEDNTQPGCGSYEGEVELSDKDGVIGNTGVPGHLKLSHTENPAVGTIIKKEDLEVTKAVVSGGNSYGDKINNAVAIKPDMGWDNQPPTLRDTAIKLRNFNLKD